jgi:adenylate cyclase
MTTRQLVTEINDWLMDQALSETDMVSLFEGLCRRLHAIGIPVARFRLMWPTLHPLFQAETILWENGGATEFDQFEHHDIESPDWLASPMKYMFDNGMTLLRRPLEGPDRLIDFPVLEDLVERGMTDYLAMYTSLAMNSHGEGRKKLGIISTWSSDQPGGFNDEALEAMERIQRRFAVACKTVIQSRIAKNITVTYLGKDAGAQVLAGSIRRGDGNETEAVVWYNDLRNSTALADTMAGADFIQLLNTYFDCTASPVIEAGGEVLDFIGDGVLAIFPYRDEAGRAAAITAATVALRHVLEGRDRLNAARLEEGLFPLRFGIGLNTGKVMFGNIGVQQRLTFSVIGPTVNEVCRIESLTKATGADALVTGTIASLNPECWESIGRQRLNGVAQEIELFAPASSRLAPAIEIDAIRVPAPAKN